ncbi:sugar-binding transcriptional regulator [Sphaerotilus mobilis]|uniref:DNA-binding transcriptional regulator LsrR (DeoR family) n=1 Tax=Sphaerotilus mobilis TaxID=47994 RepID=A0A4Q7LRR2_9BURK|nr:sugar-binding transcriptional regulator [Sphaerotilus mobilis]RZS56952.1 DNA-binding transcriptional regulator LsrR (DeoR family) [Sphaerotilus mobilis]
MTRLRRANPVALSDTASLRLRAARLYYHHGLTQKDIAERLGLGRSTVVRMLEEALRRHEVRIWIDEGDGECIALALQLEQALGLDEAVVVPSPPDPADTPRAVGLALGQFLSEALVDGQRIGVGWGRTLTASLASFRPPRHTGMQVMSLLGGTVQTDHANPVEFAWRVSSLLDARCHLFPAPVLVDSPATRRLLIEHGGLAALYRLAESLDLAILSVGDVSPDATALGSQLVTPAERRELSAAGAVADVMCNFIDAHGRSVDHPVNDRVMSVGLDAVRQARHVLIAAGGAHRAPAILAARARIGCHTLVTDEAAARALLARPEAKITP